MTPATKPPRTQTERLAVLETEVGYVKAGLETVGQDVCDVKDGVEEIRKGMSGIALSIADKADRSEMTKGLSAKAEKAEFDEMRRLLTNILIAIAAFLAITLISIVLVVLNLT